MLASFLTIPAVITTPGSTTNSVGDPIVDWGAGITTQDTKVWVEPRRSGENDDLRQMDKYEVRLFLGVDVAVEAGDRVSLVDGTFEVDVVFEVDGPPMIRRTPRGPHHQEVRCTAVVG